jgi:hypothetical protein
MGETVTMKDYPLNGAAPDGYYYLHTNGALIWKKFRPEDDSPFVRRVWGVDVRSRFSAWVVAIEALALGADRTRIDELAAKWGLTDEDGQEFVRRSNGKFRLFRDGDQWCAVFDDFVNLQESKAGFGETCLEALAELAKPGLCAT